MKQSIWFKIFCSCWLCNYCETISFDQPIFKKPRELVYAVDEVLNNYFAPTISILGVISAPSQLIDSFVEEFLLISFGNSKTTLRLESSVKLTPESHLRRCTIIFSENFSGFLEIYKKISSKSFKFDAFYLIVLIAGEIEEIEAIFQLMWTLQMYNVNVMFEDSKSNILVKTFIPFNNRSCSDTSPVLINQYRNGKFVDDVQLFFPKKFRSLHNCSIRVAVSKYSEPYIIAQTFKNGTIALSGRDIELVTTLAETLNFHINYTYIGVEGYFFENGSCDGPLREIKEGRADLALADFWLKANRLKYFEASSSYNSEQIVFVVSSARELNSLEKLIFPFKLSAWLLLLSSVLVGLLVIFKIKRRPKNTQNFVFGTANQHPYLTMFIAFIGGSLKTLPQTNFARFLLMMFLILALVIRTLYQGSFYELMKSNRRYKEVQTIEDMIDEDFSFYIFEYIWDNFQGSEKIISR